LLGFGGNQPVCAVGDDLHGLVLGGEGLGVGAVDGLGQRSGGGFHIIAQQTAFLQLHAPRLYAKGGVANVGRASIIEAHGLRHAARAGWNADGDAQQIPAAAKAGDAVG
jgi:hypothetical protein